MLTTTSLKHLIPSSLLITILAGMTTLAGSASVVEFADPLRMKAGGKIIKVDNPGYAAPCWADIDNDGDKDLLVGQYKDGNIHVFYNNGDGTLAAGKLLKAEGKTAIIPGIY